MYKSIDELAIILRATLRSKGYDVAEKQDDIIVSKNEVERAIAEINNCRRLKPTIDRPYDKKYESLIIPLCVSAYSKIGAEGEVSHSENGIVRTYSSGGDYPIDILNGIIPLIK